MFYQTVKTPSKCSHNLWIIKANKKLGITLSAVHYIYVIKSQLGSLLSTCHIFSYFDFQSFFPVKKCKSNLIFSCKAPRLSFSFLPPVRFQIFTAGFSIRIFIFPLVHWLKKSDYSSLYIQLRIVSKRLTILAWKNLCFTKFSTKIHWITRLTASDVFHMFTQSIKFF